MQNKSAEWTGKMRNEKCGILASYFGENSKKTLPERNFWRIIQIDRYFAELKCGINLQNGRVLTCTP